MAKYTKNNLHKGHRERMRKRFDASGFTGWSKFEILEYMLYNVYTQSDTNVIAHALFDYSAQSIVRLLENSADLRMASDVKDVGPSTVRFLRSLKEFMIYYRSASLTERPIQLNRGSFYEVLGILDLSDENEEIAVVCMDRLLRIKAAVNLTERNDAGCASFQIDKLIKTAVRSEAANVALIHTHPIGIDRASYEDIVMTREVKRILETIHVSLVDHFIVCGDKVISIMQTMRKMEERDAGTNRR